MEMSIIATRLRGRRYPQLRSTIVSFPPNRIEIVDPGNDKGSEIIRAYSIDALYLLSSNVSLLLNPLQFEQHLLDLADAYAPVAHPVPGVSAARHSSLQLLRHCSQIPVHRPHVSIPPV